jgi:hypothetical protein
MWSAYWNVYRNELKIIVWVLFVNLCFLFSFHNFIKENGSYYPETPTDLAYSFYKDNALIHYTAQTIYRNKVQIVRTYRPLEKKIPVFESPGYAWFMGLLWKITGSLKYYDMQILQMLLFVFSCLLLYWSTLLIVDHKQKALYAVLAVPLFFPLMFLNINPIRDAFCFYGVAMLLYLIMMSIYYQQQSKTVIGGSFFIVFCQWMRPTVFGSLGAGSIFVIGYFVFFNRKNISKILVTLMLIWVINVVAFWVPWTLFNKHVHGRYFAGPTGRLLLSGMGYTSPNKINPQCSDTTKGLYCDSCMAQYTIKRFDIDVTVSKIGTLEFEDKIKEAFWEWFNKDPWFWVKGVFWRLKKVLFLDMTWSTTHGWNWEYYNSFDKYIDRLKAAYSYGLYGLLEFLFRRWHVRIFMLLGYLGAFCLVYEQKFFFLGLLVSLTAGGISPAILSHPEHRYLTPFYFIFPLFAGYGLYVVLCWLSIFLAKKGEQEYGINV